MQFLLYLAISVGLGLLAEIVKPKAPKAKPSGIRQQLAVGGDEPLSFILGRCGTAGYLEYVVTWGEVDDVPNAYLTMVISVSDIPVRGLNRLFVNGEAATIGETHNSKGYPVTISGDGGVPHIWIEFFDGTQTTADSFMLSKFASGNRRWRDDMIGRGIAYARVTTLYNRELFNGIPEFFFEVDGIDLTDPRGDDAQDNPIVMIHQVLSGIYFGDEWVFGLQDLPATRLPSTNWEAEMDKCDVSVATKAGGTEARFRAGAEIKVDQQPIDVINELLESCNGRIAEIGGIYKVLVAEPDNAVVSFTDEDIVITETQSFSPFPGLENTYNAINATYVEPDERWAVKQAPQLRDTDFEAADDDRRLPADVSFPMVYSGTQAQRLMSALLKEDRRFRSHAMTMPPEWWEYEVLDVAQWTSARNGYSGKDGIITMMDDLPNGNQFVGWKEQDPTDYDWTAADDEQDFDVVPLEIERPAPQITSGFSVAPYTVVDDDDNDRRAAIEVFWDAGLVDVRAVRIQVAESWGDENVITDATVDYDRADTDPSRVIANPAILPATTYKVRGIYLPFSGRVTRWSNQDVDGTEGDWLSVTTDDVPDIPPIEVSMLGDELHNAHGLVTSDDPASLPSTLLVLQQRAEELALAVMDLHAGYRETLTVFSAQRDGANAAVIENQKAIVSEAEARAEQLQEVVSQFGDSLADGLLKFESVANASNSTARITAKVKATAGSTFSQAAYMLKAQATSGGGTISQFGVLGSLYLYKDELDTGTLLFSVDSSGVAHMKSITFDNVIQSSKKSGSTPYVYIDGNTGFFSLGVA